MELDQLSQAMPKALADLSQSSKNIEQIAFYCKSAYQTEADKYAIYQKTQQYIRDALSNVAYHVHTVGLYLTNYLEAQSNEIDKLGLEIESINSKLKLSHDSTGSSSLENDPGAARSYRHTTKQKKLEGNELPENAKPANRYQRTGLNLKSLDNVGIDLSGNKGTDSFGTPPVLQAPAHSTSSNNLMTSSGSFIRGSPRDLPPPPPSLGMPPPPPTRELPPPPPRELPPPPAHDLPPPPPPF